MRPSAGRREMAESKEKTGEEKMAEGVFALLTLFIGVPISTVFSGFVISKLWLWHVVPFFGMHAMPWHTAVGLGALFGYLRINTAAPTNEKSGSVLVLTNMFVGAVSLLIGYLAI
jgi:hypothetical protein